MTTVIMVNYSGLPRPLGYAKRYATGSALTGFSMAGDALRAGNNNK